MIVCTPKRLPPHLEAVAAVHAEQVNPFNRVSGLAPGRLAADRTKYWGPEGVDLTVGLFDKREPAFIDRLLGSFASWADAPTGPKANIRVRWTQNVFDAQIRVSFDASGHWSFIGTDNLAIPRGEPTMNLQGFTMNTPAAEWLRVPPHEFGHALGFEHEHLRPELVAKIVVRKAYKKYGREQGWDRQTVWENVLDALDPANLLATADADPTSVMCYEIDGDITVDGQPIRGGDRINERDFAHAATLYPLRLAPPPAPPTEPHGDAWDCRIVDALGRTWRGPLQLEQGA